MFSYKDKDYNLNAAILANYIESTRRKLEYIKQHGYSHGDHKYMLLHDLLIDRDDLFDNDHIDKKIKRSGLDSLLKLALQFALIEEKKDESRRKKTNDSNNK